MLNLRQQIRTLAAVGATAAVGLVAAAAADGAASATVTPNQAAKGAKVHWAVDGTGAPINGQIPRSLVMSAPGFTLNTAALAKRCTTLQAKLDECPTKSRIGSAVMTVHVDKPSGARDLPINIKLYLGRNNALMAVAFLAGVRVVPGSISGSNGITVTFNPLPVPPAIPQVSYRFLGVTLDLGATRVIKHTVRHGTHKKTLRRRVYLVQTPRACPAAGWPLSSTVGLPDGSTDVFSAPVACRS